MFYEPAELCCGMHAETLQLNDLSRSIEDLVHCCAHRHCVQKPLDDVHNTSDVGYDPPI